MPPSTHFHPVCPRTHARAHCQRVRFDRSLALFRSRVPEPPPPLPPFWVKKAPSPQPVRGHTSIPYAIPSTHTHLTAAAGSPPLPSLTSCTPSPLALPRLLTASLHPSHTGNRVGRRQATKESTKIRVVLAFLWLASLCTHAHSAQQLTSHCKQQQQQWWSTRKRASPPLLLLLPKQEEGSFCPARQNSRSRRLSLALALALFLLPRVSASKKRPQPAVPHRYGVLPPRGGERMGETRRPHTTCNTTTCQSLQSARATCFAFLLRYGMYKSGRAQRLGATGGLCHQSKSVRS